MEEGQSIEPTYYLPIIPMVLINGAEGIGTGWSTSVPQYSVADVVQNVRNLMQGKPFQEMKPSYKGWTGQINENGPSKYDVLGVQGEGSDDDDEQCTISELPIGKWTQDYKKFLEELELNGDIDDFTEHHAEN